MSTEVTQIEERLNRIIGICAAIQAKAGAPMRPEVAQRIRRDLIQSAAASGIDPGSPTHFESITIAALAAQVSDEIARSSSAIAHLQHDVLAQLLEQELQLVSVEERIEADVLS